MRHDIPGVRAAPRICTGCARIMPRQGVPRIRNGVLKCKRCDPWEPCNVPERDRHGRDRTNDRRPPGVTRSVTIATRPKTSDAVFALLASQAALLEPEDIAALADRPRTWGECTGQDGPCPWVSCKYHLYLDINPASGSIKLNHPDVEPEDLQHPCVLRLAAAGPLTLEETGRRLNLTRERTRQLETMALRRLRLPAGGL